VKQKRFEVKIDHDFDHVITMCAESTESRKSTWINRRIRALYSQLFKLGSCHSVECWQDGKLVGGLYGVRLGAAFFGESMFSRATDASKVALVHLVARLNAGGFRLLDAQFVNPHLLTLGAVSVKKQDYHEMLKGALEANADFKRFDGDGDAELVLTLATRSVGL
jgi:leucyl/phenylalanyl-tRNA--protein transferase